jgi:hypothetical protein
MGADMRYALLLLTLALGGCAQIAQMRADRDDARCRSYGATPGTETYVRCRVAIDGDRELAGRLDAANAAASNAEAAARYAQQAQSRATQAAVISAMAP